MATESWVLAGPQVIDVEQVRSLRVQMVGGRVDVVAHDEPGVRLTVHAVSGRPVEVVLDEGELRVGYANTLDGWEAFVARLRGLASSDEAQVQLAVPRALAARVGTVSAEVLVGGVQQDVTVSTVSGSVVVDGTRGQLSAKSVSGDVVVREHAGSLTLNTVSGEASASGDLTIVHVNAVSGQVTLDASGTPSSVTVTGVSGDVTLRLPAEVPVRVTARSVSGRLVIDGQEYGGTTPGSRTVDLGGGGCALSATTVSGHVTVLRRP